MKENKVIDFYINSNEVSPERTRKMNRLIEDIGRTWEAMTREQRETAILCGSMADFLKYAAGEKVCMPEELLALVS